MNRRRVPPGELSRRPAREPLWKGPVEDGITSSLLQKWICCRERFALKVIEGIDEIDEFDYAMEFGNLWHLCEEHVTQWREYLPQACSQLKLTYPESVADIDKCYYIISYTFPIYLRYWENHDLEVSKRLLFSEQEFRIPYTLPSGRTITLRGKQDRGFISGNEIYGEEHKVKGRVDEEGITDTLFGNLQTMFYQIPLRQGLKMTEDGFTMDFGYGPQHHYCQLASDPRIAGVIYNVIRRPLEQFQKGSIVRRKGRGKDHKGAESLTAFYKRMQGLINAEPESYFHRWKCMIDHNDMLIFQTTIFDPMLEQLLDWWDWIIQDPFDRFATRLLSAPRFRSAPDSNITTPVYNNIHYQTPWGVYNSLALGFRGDYYHFLTTGKKDRLQKIDNLYPELPSTAINA